MSGGLVSTFADSPTMQADRPGEPAITPRGYAYAIWGADRGLHRWLAASVVEPVWATLAVFLVMGLALASGLRGAVRARAEILAGSGLSARRAASAAAPTPARRCARSRWGAAESAAP